MNGERESARVHLPEVTWTVGTPLFPFSGLHLEPNDWLCVDLLLDVLYVIGDVFSCYALLKETLQVPFSTFSLRFRLHVDLNFLKMTTHMTHKAGSTLPKSKLDDGKNYIQDIRCVVCENEGSSFIHHLRFEKLFHLNDARITTLP